MTQITQIESKNMKNILFMVGAAFFLGSLLANYTVINGFIMHPTSAVVASGETIPYAIKGKTVYITLGQNREATAILAGEVIGLLLLLTYGALAAYRRK